MSDHFLVRGRLAIIRMIVLISVLVSLLPMHAAPASAAGSIVVSEVAPWSSGNSPLGADWFELTNTGASAVNIAGWKVDDSLPSFATAIALNGIT